MTPFHKLRGQMSESMLTASFIILSGGLQDAYTYLCRDKVFANAQTGNIVLLSQSIIDKDFGRAIHYLVPLLFFALGIAIAECIHIKFQRVQRIHWRQLVLVLEILLLLAVGFLPTRLNLLANAMVSFSCAMQVQSFRKVNGYAFASTMCIGNIRSGTDALCAFIRTRDKNTLRKSLCYWGIILLFAIGAGIGGYGITIFGMQTIWISCMLLLIGFLMMFIKEEKEEHMEPLTL